MHVFFCLILHIIAEHVHCFDITYQYYRERVHLLWKSLPPLSLLPIKITLKYFRPIKMGFAPNLISRVIFINTTNIVTANKNNNNPLNSHKLSNSIFSSLALFFILSLNNTKAASSIKQSTKPQSLSHSLSGDKIFILWLFNYVKIENKYG